MRQRVVDRQAFQGSVATKCEDRFETIDLPDAKLSQLGACRLEKLFDVAPPMVRLVVFYQNARKCRWIGSAGKCTGKTLVKRWISR